MMTGVMMVVMMMAAFQEHFDEWRLIWLVLDCVPKCVLCMRKDRQPLRLNSQGTTTQVFWWVVFHCSHSLPDQHFSPGLFRSPSPLQESSSPACLAYYTNATPLLFSLFSLSVFLSLINQCQAVQKQGRHSFLACFLGSSYMSLCPDPPTPPTQRPPPPFHMATELRLRPTLPTWKLVQKQHWEGKKKVRRRHFSHFCLFFLLFPAFLRPREERDSTVVYIIHGTHRRKRAIEQ